MYIIRSSKRLTTRAVANGPAGPVLAGPVFTSYCTYFAVKPPILLRGILRALLVMLSGCPASSLHCADTYLQATPLGLHPLAGPSKMLTLPLMTILHSSYETTLSYCRTAMGTYLSLS